MFCFCKSNFDQVQGPFYAPAHTAVQKEATTLLVASGIGVTPFFSVMATKVAEEQNFEYDKDVYQSLFKEELVVKGFSANTIANVLPGKKNWSQVPTTEMNVIEELEEELKVIHMIWTIRDVKELMFYLDYVYELVKHQNNLLKPVVKVQVYLTGLGKSTDATYMMSQTLFLLTLASKTSSYMEIKFGRPDLDKEIKKIDPEQVFYCGGKVLKDTLNDLCAKHRKPFHPEDFDSGTTVLNDGIALFKKLFEKSEKKRRLERRASIHAMDNKRPGPPQV